MLFQTPEVLGTGAGPEIALFADAAATGGAAGIQRVHLPAGADGAAPHFHTASTEIFYVLEGRLQMLAGDDVITVSAGELAVIEPRTVHAFAATVSGPATALIVLTPGVERFGYFRLLRDVALGAADPADLLAVQDRYDNHFVDSVVWRERDRT